MAKEICPNCSFKMARPVSFCPECSRPTPHATEAERLEWDLGQWRRHVDRSVAAGVSAPTTLTLESVAVAGETRRDPAPVHRPAVVRRTAPSADPMQRSVPIERNGHDKGEPRRRLGAKLRTLVPSFRRSATRDRVIVLDADDPFAYTACTSCERTDWIVRTTRNEDRTYNYWCVRCSRSFKTDARLRRAMKPFLTAGSVIGLLATLSVVMR